MTHLPCTMGLFLKNAFPSSISELLEKTKPRIVTLEETEGLLSRHKPCFFTLINIFLSLRLQQQDNVMDQFRVLLKDKTMDQLELLLKDKAMD